MNQKIKQQTEITGDSKPIVSNQQGIHEKLNEIVTKHLTHEFKKPYQQHTEQAFAELDPLVQGFSGDIILDACCGVGLSTRILAEQNPQALVIGIDKSANRLTRNIEGNWHNHNYHLVRADLNDFYRLVKAANWPIKQHYILYPNPWPKSKHIQRRWHGSAVFPQMIQIGEQMILRSNWLLYLQEFQVALKIAGIVSKITPVDKNNRALTPFEAKYQASGQQCWQLFAKMK
jgi:tRNA G46 methylase TrmB